MNIVLIFAPYGHLAFEENVSVVDNDFGCFPPINLAYAASIIEKHGHNVVIIDANALKLDIKKTIKIIKEKKPDLIGFYFSTYMFNKTLAWAKEIKNELKVPIIAGGINLQLYPKESLMNEVIDYGFFGDSINSLPKFLSNINKKKKFKYINGLVYKKDGEIIVNNFNKEKNSFDDFPFPSWHLLPLDKYYSFISQRKYFCIMLASLGCPYKCSFCAISNINYRIRSVNSIINEIDLLYNKFNVREIDFFDADFTLNKKRTIEICEEIKKLNYNIEWSCRTRTDNLDYEIIKNLSMAGCRQVYLGIETENKEHLKKLNKKLNKDEIIENIKLLKKFGIRPLGFFMTGLPDETPLDIIKTAKFAINLKLDYAQFSRLIPKPNSNLHYDMVNKTGIDYWRDWVLGNEKERRIGSPWTKMNEKTIERFTKLAYYLFYFRPGYIIKAIFRTRSFGEFYRSFKSAIKMIFSYFINDK